MNNERQQPAEQTHDGSPPWLEPVDHTADAGFIVYGSDLRELFARAGWGLSAVITDPDAVRPEETRKVTVEASDRQALMVRWLSELNYIHITEHRLFCRFEIEELTEERLAATVTGEPIDPRRHTIFTEVKAVTYHGLTVEPWNGGWRAQVILDL